MTALPQGNMRPPIEAPDVGADVAVAPTMSVRTVTLTSYQFRDISEWTMREFDYRLRWTLHVTHRSMAGDGMGTVGHAHATVDVWGHRDADWHPVWELSREAVSPYAPSACEHKVRDWNALLAELAEVATQVLL